MLLVENYIEKKYGSWKERVDLADEEASSNWQEDLTKDNGINKDKDGIFG